MPLAVIAIVGLFFIDGGNYEPFAPNGASLSLLSTTAALTLWAFIGLESATVPADEVKDPERTIPRATIIGTVLATLLYLVATAAIMGIIPTDQLAASTSPFADAAGEAFGGGWDKVIAAIALVSTFGALNGWILLQGRVPMAAAEDGMFPAPFAKVHGKRRTPVFGLVVSSVLVTGLMLMNYTKGLVGAFEFVILLATLTTLVPYAFSAAAQAWLWLVERETFQPLHLVRDVVIATLAFAYSVWAIAGAGDDIVTKGFILLLAGIPVYIGMRWWERRKLEHLTVPPPTRERPSRRWPVTAMRAEPATRLYVGSEVGTLRRVVLHRPDLELKRLTPRNKDALLFDDVLWVKRARQEHDAFADTLAERGVEVLYLEELLRRDPEAAQCARRR